MRKIILLTITFLFFLPINIAIAEKAKITGEYSYTYGDNESLIEAKNICYSMAVRNAIESYKTFVIATSTVNDYKLIKDLIQTISSGYIEDLKIVEETVNGHTIRIQVEGYIVPAVIDKVLTREVERLKGKEPEGVDDNGYVKILNVREDKDSVKVTCKLLNFSNSFSDVQKVIIDYYDNNGDPIGGDNLNLIGLNDMVQGQLRTIKFYIPKETKSYRVWLYKGK